jgi:hypothetical protein
MDVGAADEADCRTPEILSEKFPMSETYALPATSSSSAIEPLY